MNLESKKERARFSVNIRKTNQNHDRMDPEDLTSAFGFGHGKSKPQAKLEDDDEQDQE